MVSIERRVLTLQHLKFICLAILIACLSSCAHVKKKDGPPNYYVDETKIPNAKPKKEPLSKYGNMRSYNVFGKRYFTLRNSRRFQQTGVASWYGTSFHTRNTSSGEPYDMLAMTAAHKSLPLPTYVEVTNLNNHRKIIVKVNDRGPFKSNRIIDLSYVAAKKLGMLARGTARVHIKAIDPNSFNRTIRLSSYKKSNESTESTYLQVGTFRSKTSATKLRQRLSAMLKTPVKILRTKHRFYRVQVGPIHDLATIDHLTDRLKGIGIKPSKILGA